MTTVRMEHCRQLQYCSHGVRAFFRKYGLDYGKFLREGMDADEFLRRTDNNALVTPLVEAARGQE